MSDSTITVISATSQADVVTPVSFAAWLLPGGLFLCLALICSLLVWGRPGRSPAQLRQGRLSLLVLAVYAAALFAWEMRDMLCIVGQQCAPWLNWPAIDEPILTLLFAALGRGHEDFWARYTWLGSWQWLTVLTAVVVVYCAIRRRWLTLLTWLFAGAGIGLWIAGLKHWVERPRPEIMLIQETGWSFPSGHSAGSLAVYGVLAWSIHLWARNRGNPWLGVLAWLAALGLTASIGFSRVILSAHFASDVLAGWLLGLAWLGLVLSFHAWDESRSAKNAETAAGQG